MHDEDEFEPIGIWKSVPGGPEYLGFAAGLMPFVLTIESYSTHNGELTSYSNTPATVAGGVAILCALVSFAWISKTVPTRRGLRTLLALGLLALGGLQIARGQGVFFEVPEHASSSTSQTPQSAFVSHASNERQARRCAVGGAPYATPRRARC